MTNPKNRSGPIAGNFYPPVPGEPIRRAINDHERREATMLTHEKWMDDPPGCKNCFFLDKIEDDVGLVVSQFILTGHLMSIQILLTLMVYYRIR